MCHHPNVILSPTEENSWGIADTYQIKCFCCHKIILENAAKNEILDFLERKGYYQISENSYGR